MYNLKNVHTYVVEKQRLQAIDVDPGANNLELNHLTLAFLVTSQLEMFATLQWGLLAVFAICAFHTQHNLFGSLSLKGRE